MKLALRAGTAWRAESRRARLIFPMTLQDYKIVLYRQEDTSWVAEVPALPGCYALMATREQALAELSHVFDMIAQEYREKGLPLPKDTTEIVHA
ncbi:MAG: type II toxin-antitoxin system HicB family antitoxin [Candidatus Acidoferrales bacterium]